MARDQAGDTAAIWEGEGTPVGARAAAEVAEAAVGPWAEKWRFFTSVGSKERKKPAPQASGRRPELHRCSLVKGFCMK